MKCFVYKNKGIFDLKGFAVSFFKKDFKIFNDYIVQIIF